MCVCVCFFQVCLLAPTRTASSFRTYVCQLYNLAKDLNDTHSFIKMYKTETLREVAKWPVGGRGANGELLSLGGVDWVCITII